MRILRHPLARSVPVSSFLVGGVYSAIAVGVGWTWRTHPLSRPCSRALNFYLWDPCTKKQTPTSTGGVWEEPETPALWACNPLKPGTWWRSLNGSAICHSPPLCMFGTVLFRTAPQNHGRFFWWAQTALVAVCDDDSKLLQRSGDVCRLGFGDCSIFHIVAQLLLRQALQQQPSRDTTDSTRCALQLELQVRHPCTKRRALSRKATNTLVISTDPLRRQWNPERFLLLVVGDAAFAFSRCLLQLPLFAAGSLLCFHRQTSTTLTALCQLSSTLPLHA